MIHNDIIGDMSLLVLGGATLNTQYNDKPEDIPLVSMIEYAFENGINAIDTSPYYGDSEILYGKALLQLREKYPRDGYFICTKVGRISEDVFDYSPIGVRNSVKRSCERLHTDYLDVVYLHDVEFVNREKAFLALIELKKLKDEGIVKNIGISGYPLKELYYIASYCKSSSKIGPLDVILSYCHLTLQNNQLLNYYKLFREEGGVGSICNASILGMGLLSGKKTRTFHPASQSLKDKSIQVSKYVNGENEKSGCQDYGNKITDLAIRYSLSRWLQFGSTVIGVSSLKELKDTIDNMNFVLKYPATLKNIDKIRVKYIQESIYGKEHFNETWG